MFCSKYAEITGADLYWLLTGNQGSKRNTEGGQMHDKYPTIFYWKNFKSCCQMTQRWLEPVSAFIELLNQKKGLESQIEQSIPKVDQAIPGWIPVLGRTAAGIVHFWNEELLPSAGCCGNRA